MILTLARDRNYYRVDDRGHVYKPHDLGRTFRWEETSQIESLTDEQRGELDAERARVDAAWDAAEQREQVFCPECGKPATRDRRLVLDGRVPFVCEDRHICVDETETPRPPRPSGEDPVVAIETERVT